MFERRSSFAGDFAAVLIFGRERFVFSDFDFYFSVRRIHFHEAARFYAATFPDSAVGAVHRAPGDFPSGQTGDVLTVEFTVLGIPCLWIPAANSNNQQHDINEHYVLKHFYRQTALYAAIVSSRPM